MSSNATANLPATELPYLDATLLAADRYLRDAGERVVDWLEEQRTLAATLSALEAMSEQELHDIGLSRADVQDVARGASPRAVDALRGQ